MGTYSYAVSRFVPDPIRNEPVNIGVIVVDTETGKTDRRFLRNLRSLRPRCPGADLKFLESVIRSIRVADMPGGTADLEDLARRHTNSLQFTPPRAVVAPSLEDSLQIAFKAYIGEDAVQTKQARPKSPRHLLLQGIDSALSGAGIVGDAVARRPTFGGRRGRFTPDRSVSAAGGTVALHAISFELETRTRVVSALRDAKALAVDFEDARAKKDDLECTIVVEPPQGGPQEGAESYAQARAHLKDRGCSVIQRSDLVRCAKQIGRRLGLFDRAGNPLPRAR